MPNCTKVWLDKVLAKAAEADRFRAEIYELKAHKEALLISCKEMREHATILANKADCRWHDWGESYFVDAAIAEAEKGDEHGKQ